MIGVHVKAELTLQICHLFIVYHDSELQSLVAHDYVSIKITAVQDLGNSRLIIYNY